ncbi:MAG: dTMP kinase [Bacteroidales bacterium]|nr:dTMP kinase [Bacteroidales bacterium]
MRFFVAEGLDGSGKSTQIKLLQDYFSKNKIAYKYLHFPRTNTGIFGGLIARFLRGEMGEINHVDPYLVALLYAGDRKDAGSMIKKWLKEGFTVLLDRYVYSNIAFQCAKIPEPAERQKLKDWILNLEYEYFKIPKPDLSLFLDVPLAFTKQKLALNRTGEDRNYLQGFKDIHEKDIEFQKKVREVYLWEVNEEERFKLINCHDSKGEMLPPHEIFSKILSALNLE